MKKLGLLVGLGPETTIPYYRGIVYGMQERLKTHMVPAMTLENMSTYTLMDYAAKGELDLMKTYLAGGLKTLEKAGADLAAIACNTGHLVFDALQKETELRLVSIVDATCEYIVKNQFKNVALFATGATLRSSLYTAPLIEAGVTVTLPTESEVSLIANRIETQLQHGTVNRETVQEMRSILERMQREDAIDGVILGCTELPLVFNKMDSPVATINTIDIHVNAILDAMLED